MQFENWIDRQIREAMERGEFDNLPGAGKPLELDSSEDWWIKAKIKRENLAPVLPTALSLRREVERLPETLADVPTEEAVRAIVDAVRSPNPPRHLPLGNAAYDVGTGRLESLLKEFRAGEAVARAADSPKS